MQAKISIKAAVAEFLAMAMFVLIGCGAAAANGASTPSQRLLLAFAFGMGILVLAYSFAPHSATQINCAVTFSRVLGGELSPLQGLVNFIAQLAGSVLGAVTLMSIFSCGQDLTGNLGSNIVNPDFGNGHAIAAEIFGTFILCTTVYETAVNKKSIAGNVAPLAIGFSVFLSHLILLPIDGCSINPTRSFGPAIVSKLRGCNSYQSGAMKDLWIMFVGPLCGATLSAIIKFYFAGTEDQQDIDMKRVIEIAMMKGKEEGESATVGEEAKDIHIPNDV